MQWGKRREAHSLQISLRTLGSQPLHYQCISLSLYIYILHVRMNMNMQRNAMGNCKNGGTQFANIIASLAKSTLAVSMHISLSISIYICHVYIYIYLYMYIYIYITRTHGYEHAKKCNGKWEMKAHSLQISLRALRSQPLHCKELFAYICIHIDLLHIYITI